MSWRWRLWIAPLITFAAPLAAIASFFVFTFFRGSVDYAYPAPGLKQMISVANELMGLANFGPNRRLSLDFHPYLVPLALGGVALVSGAAGVARLAWNSRRVRPVVVLACAASLSAVEVVGLAWMTKKQFDARHVAALVPLVLFFLLAIFRSGTRRPGLVAVSMMLLGVTWFAGDLRGLILPEYQREDYRDAVKTVSAIQRQTGAQILLATDPVGPAYYGLDVRGPAPCYPIVFDCAQAFEKTPWPRGAPAWNADRWTADQIRDSLTNSRERGVPMVILHRLNRAHRDSPWWPALAGAPRFSVHGFEIVVLNAPSLR